MRTGHSSTTNSVNSRDERAWLKEVQYLTWPKCLQEQESIMARRLYVSCIQKLSVSNHFNLLAINFAVKRQFSRLRFCLIVSAFFGSVALAGVLDAQQTPKKNAPQDSVMVLQQTVR